MADLSVKVCGVDFKNPIIPASGVFGYGREYEELFPLSNVLISERSCLHEKKAN